MPTISPTGFNAIYLLAMRDTLQRTHHRHVTWNEVLDHLFTELQRIPLLEDQLAELQDKLNMSAEKRAAFAEEIALKLATQPQMPMMMQANTQQMANLAPPPPPKVFAPPQPIAQLSGDVKRDYQTEIKSLFTGEVLKPSQLSELNGFAERKVVEVDEVPFLKEKPKTFYEVNNDESKT